MKIIINSVDLIIKNQIIIIDNIKIINYKINSIINLIMKINLINLILNINKNLNMKIILIITLTLMLIITT